MLTRNQHKLLMFIHNFIQTTGIAPSFEEMFKAMEQKSKAGIHRMLGCREERGFIRRLRNRARAIEVIKLPENFKMEYHESFAGIKFVVNPSVPADEIWVRDAQGLKRFAVG